MARFAPSIICLIILTFVAHTTRRADAVEPAKNALPFMTKGFVSVPDVDLLREKWSQTQLGQLMSDPLMKPFVEDLKRQINNKLSQTSIKLGLTWEDVANVYSGEVCLALVQPEGDPKQHALALIVDVSGRNDEVTEVLAKIDRNMQAKKATKSQAELGGIRLVSYARPPAKGELRPTHSHYFVYQDQLVASDHLDTAREILANLQKKNGRSLADVKAFAEAMQRCERDAAGEAPHLRWFVEPFGYAQVTRAANGGRRKTGPDMVKILADQGFTAVQGLGGFASLATKDHEILHRSFIYAPPVAGATGRYKLAARMLDFPNGEKLLPQSWIPQDVATYFTFNWKMKEAFEYAKTLVNQIADAEVFEDVLDSIKRDGNGPQVDLRKDLVAHFSERATLLTDFRLPINPKSERLMFAIEVNDPNAVAKAIDRAMRTDRNAKKRVIGEQVVWEIINETSPDIDLKIDGVDDGFGFDEFGDDEPAEDEDKPLLPNSAITVLKLAETKGQLIIASHVDHIVDVLEQYKDGQHLGLTADYKRVHESLRKLGAGSDSFRFFSRTDRAYRPTYELVRQGKMPESETILGKLLNGILGPDEEGVLRDQQIDGSKMPQFEMVKRYLGPAGMYVRSRDDGWLAAGCLLRKLESESEAVHPALNSAKKPNNPTR